jgi:regulatory protein
VPPDAIELALRALNQRERSSLELRAWLGERGVDADAIDGAIDHLEEIGQLDDTAFARRYAEDKQELAGWGAERVREALLARGVAPEHIEAALAGEGDGLQVARASQLLMRRGQALERDTDRARALGYLTRKGYTYEIAHDAIRACERELG